MVQMQVSARKSASDPFLNIGLGTRFTRPGRVIKMRHSDSNWHLLAISVQAMATCGLVSSFCYKKELPIMQSAIFRLAYEGLVVKIKILGPRLEFPNFENFQSRCRPI